jgi:hypothetical protein
LVTTVSNAANAIDARRVVLDVFMILSGCGPLCVTR